MADLKISQLSVATVAPALSYIPIAASGANWAIPATAAAIGAQPVDATLTAVAGVTTAANKIIYWTGTDTAATADLTAFGRNIIGSASAAPARTYLELATAALKNTGTSGDTVPLLNAANTWSLAQTFTDSLNINRSAQPQINYYSNSIRRAAFFYFDTNETISFSFFDSGGNYQNVGAQIGLGTLYVAQSTGAINASAALQVDSTTKGLLPPRMTSAQRDAISSPAAGLMIYNTTTNKHQGYNGSTWNDFY